ncbi:hypothetical protein [Rhodococcus sp. IEGM 1379]|uniref:hypothetical protein n=1 Tax=Rhodococcus sp. IEGM 1379 TaxID=3047086 RepID=UPI0024B79595|nr:hypothetical protein [Rhodococcus sp. IEGM 1379]MDI9914819.1 hypothetical protein [Rhodococcus sp. IEGM 1379]
MPEHRGLPLIRASRGSAQAAFVTRLALLYARLLGADVTFDPEFGIFVATGMRRGFARGGTTLGGVYLTRRNIARAVLRHEAIHADQWARYGIVFGAKYLVEEIRHPGRKNRFEIEAGLADGGYTS